MGHLHENDLHDLVVFQAFVPFAPLILVTRRLHLSGSGLGMVAMGFFREMFPLRTNWWLNCHLHWAPPVQMAFFYSRTLCFRTPLKHYESSHSCRKGCDSPGHNGNCLIVARVLNYEVRFQNAVQIALWGKAVTSSLRRGKTLLNGKSKAVHTDWGYVLTTWENLPLGILWSHNLHFYLFLFFLGICRVQTYFFKLCKFRC